MSCELRLPLFKRIIKEESYFYGIHKKNMASNWNEKMVKKLIHFFPHIFGLFFLQYIKIGLLTQVRERFLLSKCQ